MNDGNCDANECHEIGDLIKVAFGGGDFNRGCYFNGSDSEPCKDKMDVCPSINQCSDNSQDECVLDPCLVAPIHGDGCEWDSDNNICINTPYCGDGVCSPGESWCPEDDGGCEGTPDVCNEFVCDNGCIYVPKENGMPDPGCPDNIESVGCWEGHCAECAGDAECEEYFPDRPICDMSSRLCIS